ncbi:MAG TPA: pyridoxamine 5'-phosphate oxidase family protein, partial [bacterium]|nr:pyridoxamine 5'-phosphate oxidase family protein [bacterium]
REQRLGYIATVCPDGTPNLSPKGTTTVWDDDHLLFADICSPGTLTNLAKNPSIEINVVDPMVRKGYRFKGSATILTGGAVFERALAFYRDEQRVADGLVERMQRIVLVKVERALPLISPVYDLGTSETEVAAKWAGYYGALKQGRASVRG